MNLSSTIACVEDPSWDILRTRMVEDQLRKRGITDARVLDAIHRVPREHFVPEEERAHSYTDRALPVGHGQTISQPYMTALMLQTLALHGSERVLEIGTGTGYQAALLGRLAADVHTLERIPELATSAEDHLSALHIDNVHVHAADGSQGLPEAAPFDAILVAAGAPDVPRALVEQLAPEGRLLIPLGDRRRQLLTLLQKKGSQIMRTSLTPCAFVPLRGTAGWPQD